MFPRQIRGFHYVTRITEDVTGYRKPALVDLVKKVKCVELDSLESWLNDIIELDSDYKCLRADLEDLLQQIRTWKKVK
jgi:hypothetical protein